MSDGCNVI